MTLQRFDVKAEFQGNFKAVRSSTAYIVIHHAAWLYPTYTGLSDVRAVARYHTVDRGWGGIGYHLALAEITEGGPIGLYILSDFNLQRAHIANLNHKCFGIVALTNFNDVTRHPGGVPSSKWYDAYVEAVKFALGLYPNAAIVGHTDIALKGYETSCPGNNWLSWKPSLISDAKGVDKWERWGTIAPILEHEKYFSASQLWLKHSTELGKALTRYTDGYALDNSGRLVIQFERGLIYHQPGQSPVRVMYQ